MSSRLTRVDTGGNKDPCVTNDSERSRNYIYVWNNYTEKNFDTLTHDFSKEKYFCHSKEIGSKKGTPHIQGYVEFKNARTKKALIKKYKGCYFDYARGNREQNINYTSKENNPTWIESDNKKIKFEINDEYINKCINDSLNRYMSKKNNKFNKDTVDAFGEFMYRNG